MSIGSFLASKENIEFVGKNSWKFGRNFILNKGLDYYNTNPDEAEQIKNNMERIGLAAGKEEVNETIQHIVIHYFEKLFALVKSYEAVWIVKNRIDVGDSLEYFNEAKRDNKAVFVAQSHFGATYLLGSVLMVNGFDISMVGKFPEPVGSMLFNNSNLMAEKYKTGKTHFINIADPAVDVPMSMFQALFSKKIISNVFDENNEFSRPVKLLGKDIFGGSGMDMILKNSNDEKVMLLTPFLIRTGEDTFRYEVDRHYFKNGDIINSFYNSLEKRIKKYPAQWYFIHELEESFIDMRK
ncbi:MAG: hypothetical protein JXR91_05185 [Deltaproteobacteria bacterium]|nr:hypothetical protein [Deltaproteobacteria bacterium]